MQELLAALWEIGQSDFRYRPLPVSNEQVGEDGGTQRLPNTRIPSFL